VTVSLEDQIKFQRDEIDCLQRVLERESAGGNFSNSFERDLLCMRAVLATLEQVQRGQKFRREG
jgi:hypothetical protein